MNLLKDCEYSGVCHSFTPGEVVYDTRRKTNLSDKEFTCRAAAIRRYGNTKNSIKAKQLLRSLFNVRKSKEATSQF